MGNSSKTVVSGPKKALSRHSPAAPRLKREEHGLPISQDNLFSDWKVLLGHNDWQNHSIGLEGAERYRLHNLPSSYFGPGVYELALHCDRITHGHGTKEDASRCLKKDTVVVVYVGRAENVRQRIQHYGRCGSHLEGGSDWLKNGKSQHYEITSLKESQKIPGGVDKNVHPLDTLEEDSSGCPRLFTKAFCRGCSIAFRWTATESKCDAAAIESGLLKIFDYAWNRDKNGERRPDDAFRKLQQQLASSVKSSKPKSWYKPSSWAIKLPKVVASKVRNLHEKRTLVTGFSGKLWKLSRKVSLPDENSELFLDLLSLPWKSQVKEEKCMPSSLQLGMTKHKNASVMGPSNTNVCGIRDASGMVCKVMPMQGRRRCEAHKGMRLLCASRTLSSATTKKHLIAVHACNTDDVKDATHEPSQLLVCGYRLKDGTKCMVWTQRGRKRCTSHKGMHIKVH